MLDSSHSDFERGDPDLVQGPAGEKYLTSGHSSSTTAAFDTTMLGAAPSQPTDAPPPQQTTSTHGDQQVACAALYAIPSVRAATRTSKRAHGAAHAVLSPAERTAHRMQGKRKPRGCQPSTPQRSPLMREPLSQRARRHSRPRVSRTIGHECMSAQTRPHRLSASTTVRPEKTRQQQS